MIKKLINYFKKSGKLFKASFWFAVCGFLQKGISVLTTPIFTRILSSSEYGSYSVFISWYEILSVIVTFRLTYGIYMKGLVKYDNDRDNYTSSLLGLNATLFIFFLLLYLLFSNPINSILKMSMPCMLLMFALILTTSWFNFWSARERVDFKYKHLIIVTLLISILKPAFGIIAVLITDNNKVLYRIISLVLVEFFVYVWLHVSQLKKSKQYYNKKYWKEALMFNIVLIPHYLSQIILNHSDRIMISSLCNNHDAGIYSLTYSISMLMVIFNTSLLNTLSPWIYSRLKEKKYSEISKVTTTSVIVIAIINLILILVAPEALKIFAPKSYYEALYVIPPVTMGVFFMYLYGIFVSTELYYDKNKYVTFASITGAILNIILNYIFIKKYGYMAAAYTTLVCYLVYGLMHGIFAFKIQKKKQINTNIYNYKYLIALSFFFILVGFGFMSLYKFIVLRYLLVGIILIVSYLFKDKVIAILKGGSNLK